MPSFNKVGSDFVILLTVNNIPYVGTYGTYLPTISWDFVSNENWKIPTQVHACTEYKTEK